MVEDIKCKDVLVFLINRYTKDATVDTTAVDLPNVMLLSGRKWLLNSFLIATGASATSGHYMAVVLIGNNWWLADDAQCRVLQEDEVSQLLSSCYMAFYKCALSS